MKSSKKFWQSVVVATGLLMTAAVASADGHGNNKVVKPDEKLFGESYSDLASRWSNWLSAEPIATNPAFDPDGRFCDRNQEGKVWFLASTFGGVVDRTCEIPAGKAIFVSLGGVFLGFAPEFPAAGDPCLQMATDVEKVRCDVNNDIPVAPNISLQATLDGVPVEDLFAFRAQSQPGGFTLNVPSPSLITDLGLAPGDRFPAVADGYFLLLKPLHPGVHTLSFHKVNPDQSEAGVNYTLIVGGGHEN
ncbi:MAG TPA: hypothetical protein VMW27_15655 [Thermoanaerobaculia bacterium]|nr:hypothetical protein [Thermoanaerobaculia bacterium]